MSKEKLKEIRDIYEVDAHEYIRELGFLTSDIDELMRLAYNQALKDFSSEITKYNEFIAMNELIEKLKIWKEDLI